MLKRAVLLAMFRRPITFFGMFFSGFSLFLAITNFAGIPLSIAFERLYEIYSSIAAAAFLFFFGWLKIDVAQFVKDVWLVYALMGLSMSRAILFFSNEKLLQVMHDDIARRNPDLTSFSVEVTVASSKFVAWFFAVLSIFLWPVVFYAFRGNLLETNEFSAERSESVGFRFVFAGYTVGVLIIFGLFVFINSFT